MPLSLHAEQVPDAIATVLASTGETRTYGELDRRSRALSACLRASGLEPGDRVAVLLENTLEYHEVYWAVVRSGLYFCPVNRHLTVPEVAYILNDSGARALVSCAALAEVAEELPRLAPSCTLWLATSGDIRGFRSYDLALADHADAEAVDAPLGDFMSYSSGTTGQPKGIKRPPTGLRFGDATPHETLLGAVFGIDRSTVYLSPAPLYHTAPLAYTTTVQALGGTVVIMDRFDAAEALRLIEAHRVTHSQWVPTMFSRMLKLPQEVRGAHDLSTHRVAIHAAAPCPIEVKQQMIEWWGPIIVEYYGGTEGNGLTMISSEEWLAHPGSVGRPLLGTPHICGPDGTELPPGEVGQVYFERDELPFEYHGAPDKTASAQHPEHPTWTKLGDIGYLDTDGYLYLTDREAFMIISGGVNIYPQEIENCLVLHPKVADVAVIGVPNADLGEEVKAIVQLVPGIEPTDETSHELLGYLAERLARYKVPRSIDYGDVPRLDTGKLYKQQLRDRYASHAEATA